MLIRLTVQLAQLFEFQAKNTKIPLTYMNASLSFILGAVQPRISPGDSGLHCGISTL